MSLESRLKDLAKNYDLPLDNVVQMYEGRYKALRIAFGHTYEDRLSILRLQAFKGTEMALEFKYKK